MDAIIPNPDKDEMHQSRRRRKDNVYSEMTSPPLIIHHEKSGNNDFTLEKKGIVTALLYDQRNFVSDMSPEQTIFLSENVSFDQRKPKRSADRSIDNISERPPKKIRSMVAETQLEIVSELDSIETCMEMKVEKHSVDLTPEMSKKAKRKVSDWLELTRIWVDNISDTSKVVKYESTQRTRTPLPATTEKSADVDQFQDAVMESEYLNQYRLSVDVDSDVSEKWDEEEIAETVRKERERKKLEANRQHEIRFQKYIKYRLKSNNGFELKHISPRTISMIYKLGEMHHVLSQVEFEYSLALKYNENRQLWKVLRMKFPILLVEERSRFIPGVPDSELVSILEQIYKSVIKLAKDQVKIIKYRKKRNIRSTEIAEDWRDQIEI